ncbi:hypothetical protein [Mycolicibacterium sp.]|uniref:hypothetical protein n=1 Tax=Mycolicibacterium sp. TaxID=2320850 RepID=UPI0037C535D8
MQLETEEQALAYLAQFQPGVRFNVYRFESGWICMEDLTAEENLGRGLGMASMIIDKQTGVVTVQSSQPMDLVAHEYSTAKRTGKPLPGRQIYPPRWTINLRRIREDAETIHYQLTAQSLSDPPEPNQQYPLTINKHTFQSQPADWMSTRAMAHAEWMSRQNQGIWPERMTAQA